MRNDVLVGGAQGVQPFRLQPMQFGIVRTDRKSGRNGLAGGFEFAGGVVVSSQRPIGRGVPRIDLRNLLDLPPGIAYFIGVQSHSQQTQMGSQRIAT